METWGQYAIGSADYDYIADVDGTSRRIHAEVRYPVNPIDSDSTIASYGDSRPIAFFMHGNVPNYIPEGGSCADNDNCGPIPPGATPLVDPHLGFISTMEALARDGFIAVSIDVSEINCIGTDPLIGSGAAVWAEHLSYWEALNEGSAAPDPFGATMVDRVDLSRAMLIGHSRGAMRIPMVVQQNPSWNFVGAVMLAPPDYNTELKDVPLLLLRGSRDIEFPSFVHYDRASVPIRSQMYMEGGTHTGFFDNYSDYCESRSSWPYASGPYLSPYSQRPMLREWLRRFARQRANIGGAQETGVFSGDAHVRGLENDRVSIAYSSQSDLVLDDFEDGDPLSSPFSTVVIDGFDEFEETVLGGSSAPDFYMEHDTSGLYLVSEAGDGYVHHEEFPNIDVSEYAYLSFRVGRSYLTRSDLVLLVAMNGGGSQAISTTDIVPIPKQPNQSPSNYSAMTTTVRIPRTCLSAVNPEAEDILLSTYIENLSDGSFMLDDLAMQR